MLLSRSVGRLALFLMAVMLGKSEGRNGKHGGNMWVWGSNE